MTVAARLLAFVLLCFCIVSRVSADDVYVDNVRGNDKNQGTLRGGAVKTIQAALHLAMPGDRILLRKNEEPYREAISITGWRSSGFLSKPLVIEGNGCILEGADSIPMSKWQSVGNDVFRYLPERISHQRLFLDGKPLPKISPQSGGYADLKPLDWTQVDGWIYFRTEANRAPYQYDLACCKRMTGITIFQAQNVVIKNITVQGFQLDGVNAHDLTEHCRLAELTVRGNGRSGITACNASSLAVRNCLIGDNGSSQVRAEGSCKLELEQCDLIDQAGIETINHLGGRVVVDGQKID